MKKSVILSAMLIAFLAFTTNSFAQEQPVTPPANNPNWVDADGDGVCDNVGTEKQGVNKQGKGYGKKDGSGNPLRPKDGTGFGAKKAGKGNRGMGNGTCISNQAGTGVCDGTGPKGTASKSQSKGNKKGGK
ncbi:MAG: hypothetical protein JEY94_08375 [Melioribacteraceae bacterium]|nr:hypothetical protein [Melioribacteraceae bacterium]